MANFRNYIDEDINYIKEYFYTKTNKEIGDKIGKTDRQVAYVARKLNLVKQPHEAWQDKEIQYIKENYEILTSEEMGNYLNRSVSSINGKRAELGLWNNESWNIADEQYLIDNFLNMTHAEMGEILNRSETAVRAKCFELNLYKKELPWEEWELNYVKDNYMELQTKEIAEFLNRTSNAVKLKAERMGYKKYPYSCDYHYFNEINTEEKAYWLGFLSADGWISKSEKSGSGVLGVELQYGDINHLRKFNKSLQGNYKITDRWRSCPLAKDKEKLHHSCCLRIFSRVMYEDLVALGFSNDKSYDFEIPDIDLKLVKHYIRGYFDGDGCFCLSNKNFDISFITVSERLCNSLMRILQCNEFYPSVYTKINEYGNIEYRPTFNKNIDRLRFLDWIYEDATIYLDRKYKKYLKAKEKYDSLNGLASQE